MSGRNLFPADRRVALFADDGPLRILLASACAACEYAAEYLRRVDRGRRNLWLKIPFLTDDLLRQLISVGEVDLLVGIPSHNNAETIGHTVEAVEESFQSAFPRQRVVIVDVDTGSNDGTPESS